jgi:hypothetical protein
LTTRRQHLFDIGKGLRQLRVKIAHADNAAICADARLA